MKGIVLRNKSLSIQNNLERPSPKRGEVLVKVKYASINSYDVETIEGQNALLKKLGGEKTYPVMTGIEFSGVVQSDGLRFKKGDEVYGYPDLAKGQKSHQEYITIKEDYMAFMPTNIDFAKSASLPLGALTSLVGLKDIGKIKKGSKVLINGAAGGLGVYAVQIAKIWGADVTAVVGPGQEAFIKALGADKVINYKEQKLQELSYTYDIIFDLTTKVKFSAIKVLLSEKGIFIPANPFNHIFAVLGNVFRRKKVGFLMVARGEYPKLTEISRWVEQGTLMPVIDRSYEFKDYQQGFDRTLESGKRGRIILKIEDYSS
ncbi:MAG: NAD(P)-dependent alcohol dehydrogenase [Saprospiraceae bacterium]|nr:NAD(P)-dependent alcohol dehydrogenase [Saprospiraceae bacterium]